MTNTFTLPLAQGPAQGGSQARQSGGTGGLAGLAGGARSGRSPLGAGSPGDDGGGQASFQSALAARRPGGHREAPALEAAPVPPDDRGVPGGQSPDPSTLAAAAAVAPLPWSGQAAGQGEAVPLSEPGAPTDAGAVPVKVNGTLPGFQGPVTAAWGHHPQGEAVPGAGEQAMEAPVSQAGPAVELQVQALDGPQDPGDEAPAAVIIAGREGSGRETGSQAQVGPSASGSRPPSPAALEQENRVPAAGREPVISQALGTGNYTPVEREETAREAAAAPVGASTGEPAPVDLPPPAPPAAPPDPGTDGGPARAPDGAESPMVDQGPAPGGPRAGSGDGFRLRHGLDGRGLRVAFAPEGLGPIEIAVREERLGLGLRLHAAEAATARLLAANLDDLVTVLRQREPATASVSVRHSGDDGALDTGSGYRDGAWTGDGGSTGTFHREFRYRPREHPGSRVAVTRPAAPAASGPSRTGRPPYGRHGGGRLNRWV